MEPPECPVCLQAYNTSDTIPRVLSCGHTICQQCILSLPRPLIHAVRCPACNQLAHYPHPLGPTSLPRNIDLLRFSPDHTTSSSSTPPPAPPLIRRRPFPPEIFSDELYQSWKDWVIPNAVVSVEEGNHDQMQRFGEIKVHGNELGLPGVMRRRLVDGHKVGLVEMGRFFEESERLVEYSYVSKVMSVLGSMSVGQRDELGFVLGLSLRVSRVLTVLGVWLDLESGCLYLVGERGNDDLGSLGNGDMVPSCLAAVGIELCEVLISLRSEGFVCGCLGLSCFGLDEFRHVYIDPCEVLVAGMETRERVVKSVNGERKMDGAEGEENADVFVSPEVVLELLSRDGVKMENDEMGYKVDYSSDVWLFACVLLRIAVGKRFVDGMYDYVRGFLEPKSGGTSEARDMYQKWIKPMGTTLEEAFSGSDLSSLCEILVECLDINPESRPSVTDVWDGFKGVKACLHINRLASLEEAPREGTAAQCLVLGELCKLSNNLGKESRVSDLDKEYNDCETDPSLVREVKVESVVKGLSAGQASCKDLRGHLDCVTGFCVGGGFLFSSSFDKTINLWSLEDFTHVYTFRGHEHRVMAVVFVSLEKPLCISADSGGGIFCWEVIAPFGQEPLKKWYEEKDWRYSGIHALAVSESGFLYTGSGDKLIKAWSLREHTLLCSMEGHKSVVSALALCNGVLYSGSWDGTVRLWSLHDHSPLAVFGEHIQGTVSSVLSIHADENVVLATHESGCIKIWMNDVLKASKQVHKGAIFALAKEGKWVFTGGWDRAVTIQEVRQDENEMGTIEVGSIASDSVITALLYVHGILFVGCANKLIKVYYCGS